MGRAGDELAVVDPGLHVRGGIEAPRFADPSVMPDMIGGNINAAVVMIAERAADMILKRTED
jgi:4-pyridoxate dehydrogenase